MPHKGKPHDETEEEKKKNRGVLRSGETGRPSGIEIRDRTFLGLNPEDVQRITQGEQGRAAGVPGAEDIGTQKRQEQVREEIGTRPLRTELEQKIAEPQSLAPPTREESRANQLVTAEAQREFFSKLFTGKASSEEIISQAKA